MCPTACDNGGVCSGPGTCSCPPGFTGPQCQQDVDECAAAAANNQSTTKPCGTDGVCVNMPGWHYCACRDGYTAYHNPLDGTAACVDEDECAAGTATCLPPAVCHNTPGGYTCDCPAVETATTGGPSAASSISCSGDCFLRDAAGSEGGGRPTTMVIAEESFWQEGCNTCSCLAGRVTCRPASCNCQQAAREDIIRRGCCPECDGALVPPPAARSSVPAARQCQHGTGRYRPGQRWIHHCMECECRQGEVDCWPLSCPAHCGSAHAAPCCSVAGGGGNLSALSATCSDGFGGPVAAASRMGPDSYALVSLSSIH